MVNVDEHVDGSWIQYDITINHSYSLSNCKHYYLLVNSHKTMENHHFQWVNQQTKWLFSSSQTVGLPEGWGVNGISWDLIGY